MGTEIQTFEDYMEQIKTTYENMKEDGEDNEWYVIEGERIDDFNMSIDDSKNAIKMGAIGWSQDVFEGEADVRNLWGTHDVFTTKLLVHEDELSDKALEVVKEQQEEQKIVDTEEGKCAICGKDPEDHSEQEKQECLDKATAGDV